MWGRPVRAHRYMCTEVYCGPSPGHKHTKAVPLRFYLPSPLSRWLFTLFIVRVKRESLGEDRCLWHQEYVC